MLRNLPLHFFQIDKVLENLHQRDASDRQSDLDLQDAGINMVEPLRAICCACDVEAVDKNTVPALHHHDDEVGDHAGVHEAQQHDHQGFHVPRELVDNETIVVDEERHDVQGEGYDERDVDRVENPPHRKDRVSREFAQIPHQWMNRLKSTKRNIIIK